MHLQRYRVMAKLPLPEHPLVDVVDNVIAGTPKVYEALVAALGPLVPEPLREA